MASACDQRRQLLLAGLKELVNGDSSRRLNRVLILTGNLLKDPDSLSSFIAVICLPYGAGRGS